MKRGVNGWIWGFWLLLALAPPALANVKLENGNFYIGYTDVLHDGNQQLKLERVYNSKTAFKGIFGWGWGSDYEAYLQLEPDGSVTYHEYGGGADNRFDPPELSAALLEQSIAQLIAVARTTGALTDADSIERYRLRARADATFRSDEWEKYRKRGLLPFFQVPFDVPFRSTRFGARTLTRVQGGYLMRSESNSQNEWRFDEAGRLKTVRQGAHRVECGYDRWGRLTTLSDGRRIELFYDERGRVREARDGKGQRAIYRYSDADDLIYNRDADGNVYEYRYSPDSRHLMTQILYDDASSLEIEYYPSSLSDNIRAIKDRDNTRSAYLYSYDPHDPHHIRVSSEKRAQDGETISLCDYEYFRKTTPEGVAWLARFKADIDGLQSDTTYNRDGLPLRILSNGEEKSYRYDAQGRTIRYQTTEGWWEYEYEPVFGKVALVTQGAIASPAKKIWNRFDYDSKGQLSHAEDSAGQKLTLEYNETGGISALQDEQGLVEIGYNGAGKITRLTMLKPQGARSSVNFEYEENGELKPLAADANREVTAEYTRLMRRLTELSGPASRR